MAEQVAVVRIGGHRIPLPSGDTVAGHVSTAVFDEAVTDLAAGIAERPTAVQVTRSLFEHNTDVTTVGTTEETLYTDSLLANTLATNKDIMIAEYEAIFAFNANEKRLIIFVGSYKIPVFIASGSSGGHARVIFKLHRVSSSVLRWSYTGLVNAEAPVIGYGEITTTEIASLNVTTTAYNLILKGRSTDAAGDLTAKMGNAILYPAA